jgi:glutathione peroxidase
MKQKLVNFLKSCFFIQSILISSPQVGQADDYPSIELKNIMGDPVPFSSYKGKVLLIVNTASECGYTPQYRELEELFQQFSGQDFFVLGFPSNDFGGQEPGSNNEIKEFCKTRFRVTFPLFEKGSVTGASSQPLFSYLTTQGDQNLQGLVKWNFEKFLVDKKEDLYLRPPLKHQRLYQP